MQVRKRDVIGFIEVSEQVTEDTIDELSETATEQLKATIADLLKSNEGLAVKQVKYKLTVVIDKG